MNKSSCKPPYPQRLKQEKLNKEFAKFFKQFNQLHINIPFADAIAQMPSYTKFIKEMLMNKRKIDDNDNTVVLMTRCSAILQNKLLPKLKDPRNITIPCTIGNFHIEKTLCDLGAIINLMPLSIFNKLGVGELKLSNSTLKFKNKSIKKASGVVEDFLVKVGKFVFTANIIVLDMEVDHDVPVIVGIPFLVIRGGGGGVR